MNRICSVFLWATSALVFAVAPAKAAAPDPLEHFDGATVLNETLTADDGAKLRVLITRPSGVQGRLPAILFIQWLSCSTVAVPQDPKDMDGWSVMLKELITRSGALVWRTEKRGVGGSDGRCDQLDYDTDLADQRAALRALRARPDVDPDRIVVFGASMGSNLAPLVAADQKLAGVLVWGGGARTWAERTLAFERNRLELGDVPATERTREMTLKYELIEKFLIQRMTPAQIAAADPELGEAWSRMGGGPRAASLYGRPLSFHRQAQAQDWAGAWTHVQAPVLAMIGENDWFEDASGVQLIADVVNRAHPGTARAVVVSGLDHHFARYPDRRAAFKEAGGTIDPQPMLSVALPWLRERLSLVQ